ncbi:MAG TPA: HDOD domain-containing protein [Polyangiaceae bacterium]
MEGKQNPASYRRVVARKAASTRDLLAVLEETFASPGYLPPLLPSAAFELLEMSRRPEVALPEVVALVERDPLIAGRVLQVAQSARYSTAHGMPSLQHAVVRLGLDTMTNIFLEVAMNMRVFRAPGYDEPMKRLRLHSVATANVARIVCRHTSIFDDYAFLCGLLHDVGIAASLIVLADIRSGEGGNFAVEWPVIRALHGQASRVVCEAWKLPPDLALAVEHHHDYTIGSHVHPVAAAVAVAEAIATKLGFGFESEASAQPPSDAMKAIGLSDTALLAVLVEAKAKLADLR